MDTPTTAKNRGYYVTLNLKRGKSIKLTFANSSNAYTGFGKQVPGRGFLGKLGLTNDYEFDGEMNFISNMSYFLGWAEESKKSGLYVKDGHIIKVEDVKSYELTPFEYEVGVTNNVGANCY